MYTWSAYYGSLYCRLANDRGSSDSQGDHPDINGIYNYMTAELLLIEMERISLMKIRYIILSLIMATEVTLQKAV